MSAFFIRGSKAWAVPEFWSEGGQKHTFYLLFPIPFSKEIESVSLKKRAKRVGIEHKMCVLGKQETLLSYTIGEKHHFNPIRSSLVITVPLF
jgi:hypothetical protein